MTVRLSITALGIWLIALAAIASAQTLPITADRPDGPNIFSTEHAVVAPVSDPHLAVPVAGRPTVAFPTTAFEAWTTGANAEAGAPSSRARSGQTPVFLRVYGGLGS